MTKTEAAKIGLLDGVLTGETSDSEFRDRVAAAGPRTLLQAMYEMERVARDGDDQAEAVEWPHSVVEGEVIRRMTQQRVDQDRQGVDPIMKVDVSKINSRVKVSLYGPESAA